MSMAASKGITIHQLVLARVAHGVRIQETYRATKFATQIQEAVSMGVLMAILVRSV